MFNKKPHLYSVAMLPGIVQALDLAVIVLAAVLAHLVYFRMVLEQSAPIGHYALVVLAAVLLWINVTHDRSLYSVSAINNLRSHARQTAFTWVLVILGVIAIGFLLKVSSLYSRGWLILWFVFGSLGFTACRLVLFNLFHRWHGFGRFALRTAIYGPAEDVRRMHRFLHEEGRQSFVRITGLFSTDGSHIHSDHHGGGFPELLGMARQGAFDTVILAFPWSEAAAIHEAAQQLRNVAVDVRLGPEKVFFELPWRRFSWLGGIPMLNVRDRSLKEWNALLKRAEDIIIGGLMLLGLSPLLLLAAALVRLDSPGPVFFRQKRFGFNNREIEVFKFRTMYVDKGDASGAARTVRDDPRVTRIGRILRKFSIDEFPQLLNVMKGEMSLVGPRAHPVSMKVGDDYYHHVFAEYAARHRVRPGITGLAQVRGCRGEVDSIEKARRRLEYDLFYVDHWSVWLDLRVMLQTAWQILFPKDVY